MVFAHLGFVDVALSSSKTQAKYVEEETSLVKIDYRKSVAQVYTDAARSSIRRSGNLLILRQAGNIDPSLRRADLPSWVPDWMSNFSVQPFTEKFKDPPQDFLRLTEKGLWTNEHPVHTVWPQDTSALIFDGYCVDIIKDTSPVIPCYDGDVDRRLGVFINSLRITAGERKDIKQQQNLLWRETYDEWRKKPGFEFLETLHDDVVDYCSKLSSRLFEDAPSTKILTTEGFPLAAQLVCHCRVHSGLLSGRSIASFQSGNIGIVPSSARPGDLICTSYKECLRLVLRRKHDVDELFDTEIMTEFGRYYKAHGASPAEMASSGLLDILIPYPDEQGMPKPSHVTFIGECFYATGENVFNILSIFVIH
jgi:hypothetical protein